MTNNRALLLVSLFIAATAISCTTAAPPPPEPLSPVSKHLIDPTTGAESVDSAELQASTAAWQAYQIGRLTDAERQWQQILLTNPDSPVATVGLASVAFARNQFERAEELIAGVKPYPASIVMRSEILLERGNVIEAAELLRTLTSVPSVPAKVISRYEELRDRATAELAVRADEEPTAEARIETLRRAVDLAPRDSDLRLRLVEDLIAQGRYPEARTNLQPMLEYDAALNRVQAALAEIEISEGKHQSAIKRYERLVDRTGDAVYRDRLERAKRLWHESTLPQQFQLAVRAPNITREQLAVLLFWKVPSVRFAQNLPQSPIIVDIGDAMGREELIRAATVGLIPVDRATRSVRPRKTVTAAEFLATASSALRYASNDPCTTPREGSRPAQQLEACGIDTMGLQRDPAGFVTGAAAASILDQIAALDHSAE